MVEIFVDGSKVGSWPPTNQFWEFKITGKPARPECLGWDLKPLPPRPVDVMITAKAEGRPLAATLIRVPLPSSPAGKLDTCKLLLKLDRH